MTLQCPGTSVLPLTDGTFEKPALKPYTGPGLRILAVSTITSPGSGHEHNIL
jgi:hypothetical protein